MKIKLILCVVLSVYSCLTGVLNLKPDKMEEKEKEFAQIVKEHKRQIYTVCYMFSKDADEVADLFQEILINMWKGFRSFRGESSVSTWVWRISLNTCINTRKRRKLETIPLNVNINPYEDVDEDVASGAPYWRRLVVIFLVEPVLWCGLELIRSRFFGGFAWNQLGVVLANTGFSLPASVGCS